MPIDLFPNINYPSLRIGTIYKGASAQDVERTVTYPIEKAVSAVANVRYVESRSRQGFSVVTVQFSWGADVDAGLTEVMQRIQAILSTLPVGVQQPFILKFDLSNIPVCILTASGGGLDERALYDLAYNTIEPQIERHQLRQLIGGLGGRYFTTLVVVHGPGLVTQIEEVALHRSAPERANHFNSLSQNLPAID